MYMCVGVGVCGSGYVGYEWVWVGVCVGVIGCVGCVWDVCVQSNISLIKDQEVDLLKAKRSSLGDDAERSTSSKQSSFPEVPYLLKH